MKKLILTLMAASSFLCAADTVQWNFDKVPENANVKLSGLAKVEDGTLKMPWQDKRGSSFRYSQEQTKSFRLQYKVRMMENDTQENDRHFHVGFLTGDGATFNIYSAGKNFFYIHRKDGKNLCYLGGGKNIDFNDYKWKQMDLIVTPSYLQVSCDGQVAFVYKVKIFPVKDIHFGNWKVPFEVDDIKISELPPEKSDLLSQPALTSNFSSNGELKDWNGNTISPVNKKNVALTKGISETQAIDPSATLEYKLPDVFRNSAGGVMFWFRPKRAEFRAPLIGFYGEDGKDKLNLNAENAFTAFFARSGMEPYKFEMRGIASTWLNGTDWVHCAVTWNDDIPVLYINGLPYSPTFRPQNTPLLMKDLETIRTLRFFKGAQYDRFTVFRRPVSNTDIWNEYRSVMPVDMVMQKQMFDASEPVAMSLQIAPGGYWMRPMPVNAPQVKADIKLKLKLVEKNKQQKVIFEKEDNLKVNAPLDYALPKTNLKDGKYLLLTEVNYGKSTYLRTFEIDVYTPVKTGTATDSDYKKGKLIYEEKFQNPNDPKFLKSGALSRVIRNNLTYFETGNNRHDRFSFEIKFPKHVLGKPVLIEVVWPDDKTRMVGHYIYAPSKGYSDRDRLQQGIQSGLEYPNSGKMVTTKYLFWPGSEDYLIEFRTMAKNMPAAVASLKFFEIDGALPVLKIREPEMLPGRMFGNMDEDQTWTTNMNRDWYDRHPEVRKLYPNSDAYYTDELLKYMAYTGQNTFHYQLLRYWYPFYLTEGKHGSWLPPAKAGSMNYFVDTLGKHGIDFTVILAIWNTPDVFYGRMCDMGADMDKKGMLMHDKDGKIIQAVRRDFGNLIHPEVRRMNNVHIYEIAKLMKNSPNVKAFELWQSVWYSNRTGLNSGYDDYTVAQFTKETGISVPKDKRFEFLTGEKRKEWIDWRCKKSTEFVKSVRQVLDSVNPKWKLYVGVQNTGEEYPRILPEDKDMGRNRIEHFRAVHGIDVDSINSISNTFAVPQRSPGSSRWQIHMFNKQSAMDEFDYDYKGNRDAFCKNGSVASVSNWMVYYENMEMKKTLMPDKYSSFFQDADIKPHGRHWLKPLVFSIASMDALKVTIGAQPLGTLGREDEGREFAKAYRALPALAFKDVPSAEDPVTVRYLETANGTYFYLANMIHGNCKVTLDFSARENVTDLSSGEKIQGNVFDLKPYQLRSFLIPGKKIGIKSAKIAVDDSLKAFYAERLSTFKTALGKLQKVTDKPFEMESATAKRIENELKNGHYAEAHRLLFSLEVRNIIAQGAVVEKIAKQSVMIRQGHIAINCGSDSFYTSQDGKLFFPDQAYKKGRDYGYYGAQPTTVIREIEQLKDKRFAELYQTELYNMDGYRFKLENGLYTIRLYMRWGYQPAFRPDALIINILAQDKNIVENFDYFSAACGDFQNPLILEIKDVKVDKGELNLDFKVGKNSKGKEPSGSVRAVQGIEVQKQL